MTTLKNSLEEAISRNISRDEKEPLQTEDSFLKAIMSLIDAYLKRIGEPVEPEWHGTERIMETSN